MVTQLVYNGNNVGFIGKNDGRQDVPKPGTLVGPEGGHYYITRILTECNSAGQAVAAVVPWTRPR